MKLQKQNFLSLTIIIFASILSFAVLSQPVIEELEAASAKTWWLDNSKSPLFSLAIYLGDGSFVDHQGYSGMSASSLDLAFKGTSRYTENQISEFFDRYGASISTDVKHEFSSIYLSGLVSDMKPLVKMLCHITKDANYPIKKISSYKKRLLAGIENLETSPDAIASMVFRKESLKSNQALAIPSSGLLKDLERIKADKLKSRLKYLMNHVHRRIYISGPKSVKKVTTLLARECGWKSNPDFLRVNKEKPFKQVAHKPEIVFIPLKQSNQAQVKIGRLLNAPVSTHELFGLNLMKSYLAGAGFISELITELRVKRGLTYGVRASADMQKLYGRSVISTSTKSQNISIMLKTIREILQKLSLGKFNQERFKLVKRNLEGGYLFSFEKDENFLQNLMYIHHLGLTEDYIYNFPQSINKISMKQLTLISKMAFGWSDLTIVIAGDKSMLKSLRRIRPHVRVVNWKDYL